MQVLAVRYELFVPQARSLKERRAAVRPIVAGIRSRFELSVAEVGPQELHQRAAVGVAIVSEDAGTCESVADDVSRFVWSRTDVEVTDEVHTWTEFD